jgi:hypothetical protein
VPVAGAKMQALRAILARRPGQVVPADRLAGDLWGEDITASSANSRLTTV